MPLASNPAHTWPVTISALKYLPINQSGGVVQIPPTCSLISVNSPFISPVDTACPAWYNTSYMVEATLANVESLSVPNTDAVNNRLPNKPLTILNSSGSELGSARYAKA